MIVLDASVVIAFLDPNDRHHQRSAELLEKHANGYLMHQLTLAEVLVGAVRLGRGSLLLDALTSIGVVAHQPPANEPLVLAELRVATGLKMPDCCALAVAQHESLPLATFDEQLMRIAQGLRLQTLP